ncbi:MAG: putative Ig domain-containing protein, partial [candidate division NC10 bacterium]|nr:putative Ig domain-containing protein [candidate division NC10 bacterium]
APSGGATVSATITVSATASDNVGVVGVQFRLDSANLGAEDTASPYSVSWNSTTATNGSHTLTAVARDAAGNTTTSGGVGVTVDNSAPSVAITAPTSGATVSATITVTATASDNIGVVGVQFRVDGAALGAEDTTSPYSLSWDTTTVGNGAHTLTAVARDAAGNTTTSSGVTVTVSNVSPPPLTITTTSLPAATVGTAYSQPLAATGGTTPYTWSLASGTLPPGLSLSGGGVLSGTPTTAGSFSFTPQVTDGIGATDTQPLSLTVNALPPLNITTTSLPAATVGTAYSQPLAATGGTTPYTWSLASGTLPPGLSLSGGGVLSGTPTTAGSFSFTVRVTDSASATDTQPLSLTVSAPPNITTTSLPPGTVGAPYSRTLAATGGTTPYTWSLAAGSLPAGLSLSGGGVLSGAPSTAGTSNFTVRVTDSVGASDTQVLSLTINPPPPLNITTTSLPAGTVGAPYSQTLAATGGMAPYTWSLSSGTLPSGLGLSPGGVLGSSPTTAGTYTFTVQVSDSVGGTDTQTLSLTVSATPAPGPAPAAAGAGCFIATAAYGSALEPQVVLLRAFRDQYLVTHPPGRAFVGWYYRASPPVAATIRQSPILRGLVRVILWPLVGLAWITLHPALGGGILVGAGVITGWIGHRRRNSRRTQP